MFNSLSPERYDSDSKCIILQHILTIDILGISIEIGLRWPKDFTDDKSTLVQVMKQLWTRCRSPYGGIRGQWVKWKHPNHDDVIKWKHVPRYRPFVRWIHRSPVNSPHKGQWRGALMFSLICAWINNWVNNSKAGYYDAIVPIMTSLYCLHEFIQRYWIR